MARVTILQFRGLNNEVSSFGYFRYFFSFFRLIHLGT